MKKKQFHAEVTDLFCGELNYSFVHKFRVRAKTFNGAIGKIARHYGLHFRTYVDTGDSRIYHSASRLTGVYMEEMDPTQPQNHAEEI